MLTRKLTSKQTLSLKLPGTVVPISLTNWTHQKSSSLGTTTRTWTSSPTETKALPQNSQAPSPQFITPTSCTPLTTPWIPSCTKPRPRNKKYELNHTQYFLHFFLFKTFLYSL